MQFDFLKPPTAVIYSNDFEPISHIPMTPQMYEYFLNYNIVRFPIHSPINYSVKEMPLPDVFLYAEIEAVWVHNKSGPSRLLLISRNDETTLLMPNTFLPGQTKEVNYIKHQAFCQGLAKAISILKK
jgi:hypothetical protein